ncbi:MAG: glutamine--fructose-6-phosphate transaminase (isomerizing) [Pseudomonadota bacterium]
MCGIIAGVTRQNIGPLLVEGLQRLEYRGYDSAGIAVFDRGIIQRLRVCGKVRALATLVSNHRLLGFAGIGHTRWATHGKPDEVNAHPHMSGARLALVHNGIIDNYRELREKYQQKGYTFDSQTDTEVVAHALHWHLKQEPVFLKALDNMVKELEGAYALAILDAEQPNTVFGVRHGAPLVLGIGQQAWYVASDVLALVPLAESFIFLEEGDVAVINNEGYQLYQNLTPVQRPEHTFKNLDQQIGKGHHEHYMQKEIFEQGTAIQESLQGRLGFQTVSDEVFGNQAAEIFDQTKAVYLIACGTSYHAGLIAAQWLESIGIPARVEIASEFRHRKPVFQPGTLLVSISQSGETADTLAAMRSAVRTHLAGTLAICNVPQSTLVRESDLVFLTHAGPEIGVASTKAFTTQLVGLWMLTLVLGKRFGLTSEQQADWVSHMRLLPNAVAETLKQDELIKNMANRLKNKLHCLFLGRGLCYPVALEGALKLKELSYIHAEAYPAGELKHGPLALVDEEMPIVVVAPNDGLLQKLKSNLQEVKARGGQFIIVAEAGIDWDLGLDAVVIEVPKSDAYLSPILLTIPLQLLAYHVAVAKGTDVDQPRNLAKSVTVE